MFRNILGLTLAVFLFGCASGHRNTSAQLRQFVTAGSYDKAIEFLEKSSLKEDQKSRLLYFTELGLLHHYRENYQASNQALNSAKEIIEELYTTKVSGKVSSFLSNDNSDFYYGEKYEASLVYFYLSLNHYMNSLKQTDPALRKQMLESARAEIVAWDSFLTEMKQERVGKALFKEDLLAKVFGGLIHEAQNTHNDNQIALQLYKDAQSVLFKNYNLYPTYNESYESFRQNFSLFPKISQKEVAGKYVLATQHNKALTDFLNYKIQFLSNRSKQKKTDGSISFLVQEGLIAEKVPQKYEFPMYWGAHASMAITMGAGGRISFELPSIQGIQKPDVARLQALSKEGVVLHEAPLSIVSPVSELAQQAINEHSTSIAAKTAARVASKHLAALVASVATYESGRRNNNSMVMLLATAGHTAAVVSINESEKADVRFWSTLPASIRMGHISLPAGSYKFRAVFGEPTATEYRVIELGEHQVAAKEEKFVLNHKDLRTKSVQIAETKPIEVTPLTSEVKAPVEEKRTVASEERKNTQSCLTRADCQNGMTCKITERDQKGTCVNHGIFGKVFNQ